MKRVVLLIIAIFSLNSFSSEVAKKTARKGKAKVHTAETKPAAPCDSKEDLLKKLEEQKKAAEAEAPKAFSLQGGNTGCSVDKK